jgi:hypothetical protein
MSELGGSAKCVRSETTKIKTRLSDGSAFFSALELQALEKPVSRFALRAPRFRCPIPSCWTPCREQQLVGITWPSVRLTLTRQCCVVSLRQSISPGLLHLEWVPVACGVQNLLLYEISKSLRARLQESGSRYWAASDSNSFHKAIRATTKSVGDSQEYCY